MKSKQRRSRKYKGPTYGPFFFLVDKPKDLSSFDVIRQFKRSLPRAIGKIGHFGTLDPFATGLMMIGIGPATKINNWTQDLPKTYLAKGRLGIRSSTGDNTAPEEQYFADESFKAMELDESKLKQELKSFIGEYLQVPHAYSATKFEGKALYEWAREGVEVKKDPVKRTIYNIDLKSFDGEFVEFEVSVSSGTYIRVLFEDLAKKLGTLGHLVELRRTQVGQHKVSDALKLSELPEDFNNSAGFLQKYAKPMTELLDIKTLELKDMDAKLHRNGAKLDRDFSDGLYWVMEGEEILSLSQAENQALTPCVVFSPTGGTKIDLTIGNSLD